VSPSGGLYQQPQAAAEAELTPSDKIEALGVRAYYKAN
jgi:hypothetical protein